MQSFEKYEFENHEDKKKNLFRSQLFEYFAMFPFCFQYRWGVHGQLCHGTIDDECSPKLVTKFQGRKVRGTTFCHILFLPRFVVPIFSEIHDVVLLFIKIGPDTTE